jgi:hypothetical protein
MILKKCLPRILLLCFSLAAVAQGNNERHNDESMVRVGLKGGLSIATIIKTNDHNFSSAPLYGFNGGGASIAAWPCACDSAGSFNFSERLKGNRYLISR